VLCCVVLCCVVLCCVVLCCVVLCCVVLCCVVLCCVVLCCVVVCVLCVVYCVLHSARKAAAQCPQSRGTVPAKRLKPGSQAPPAPGCQHRGRGAKVTTVRDIVMTKEPGGL
jgi:hypothetical protein